MVEAWVQIKKLDSWLYTPWGKRAIVIGHHLSIVAPPQWLQESASFQFQPPLPLYELLDLLCKSAGFRDLPTLGLLDGQHPDSLRGVEKIKS